MGTFTIDHLDNEVKKDGVAIDEHSIEKIRRAAKFNRDKKFRVKKFERRK